MKEWFQESESISNDEIKDALRFCCEQIQSNLEQFTYRFPNAYSVNGYYEAIGNTDWTCGFWTGELWLAYEATHDAVFSEAARIQINSFYDRIKNKIAVDHHDMGFLYSPSCIAGYQLTNDQKALEAAIMAADQLIGRYQPAGEFIQAWGTLGTPENYRLIIDCLLNLPLLYRVSELTKDDKYKLIADKHIHTALSHVIRDDFSTWHTFYFDPLTGRPLRGATCQGYMDGSAWARGQAWGIYGIALAYRYTHQMAYPKLFANVTEYFLAHLPQDMIPYWDLMFTDQSTEPRDSSAAAICACGLLEMSRHAEASEAKYYTDLARKIMKSLYDHYAVNDHSASNGLVLHSTYSKHSPYNTCNHYGVDECNLWGDYFYMEALTRLKGEWRPYW